MFGLERGQQIVDLIEAATGQPCPCKQGNDCPLLGSRAEDDEPRILATWRPGRGWVMVAKQRATVA